MTKKDYELIAGVIAEVNRESVDTECLFDLADKLADKLAEANPRFDKAKFLAVAYCNEEYLDGFSIRTKRK